jgi:hypothetical protein
MDAVNFLSQLTAGQIALLTVCGTLSAAVLGGVFALVTALVNGRMAKSLARSNSRLDFRLKTLQPYIDSVDAETRVVRDALIATVDKPHLQDHTYHAACGALVDRQKAYRVASVYSVAILDKDREFSASVARLAAASQVIDEVIPLVEDTWRIANTSDATFVEKQKVIRQKWIDALREFVNVGFEGRAEIERFIFR